MNYTIGNNEEMVNRSKNDQLFIIFNGLVKEDKIDEIRNILQDNPEILNAKDSVGNTLLFNSLTAGNFFLANILLDFPQNINVQNDLGDTPLHLIVSFSEQLNLEPLVHKILLNMPDLSLINDEGDTVISICKKYGNERYTQMLLNYSENCLLEKNCRFVSLLLKN